jgi:hypothetical protein
LLIEAEVGQELKSESKAGTIAIGKMEAGFELSKGSLSAVINLEADVDSKSYSIQVNEAFISYGFTDIVSADAGQFVNAFGILGSEALSDPLIKDIVETKVPAVQLNIGNETVYGAVAVYNGLITDNFKAFVPAFGVNFSDKFSSRLSSRIEIDQDSVYADLSFGFKVTPVDLFSFDTELYSELTRKNGSKIFGYYAEVVLVPTEKLLFALKFDQLINDVDKSKRDGDLLLIDISGGYTIVDPLTTTLSLQFNGTNGNSKYEWSPMLLFNICFEI